jgi:hypothetical protein
MTSVAFQTATGRVQLSARDGMRASKIQPAVGGVADDTRGDEPSLGFADQGGRRFRGQTEAPTLGSNQGTR